MIKEKLSKFLNFYIKGNLKAKIHHVQIKKVKKKEIENQEEII